LLQDGGILVGHIGPLSEDIDQISVINSVNCQNASANALHFSVQCPLIKLDWTTAFNQALFYIFMDAKS
jgi:hypothetical protein